MTDVLVVLVSVVMITIAVTFLGDPIRARIAASIPTPFDLAMVKTLATAEPSKLIFPARNRVAGFVPLLCNGT